jgi:hypothetical protein
MKVVPISTAQVTDSFIGDLLCFVSSYFTSDVIGFKLRLFKPIAVWVVVTVLSLSACGVTAFNPAQGSMFVLPLFPMSRRLFSPLPLVELFHFAEK